MPSLNTSFLDMAPDVKSHEVTWLHDYKDVDIPPNASLWLLVMADPPPNMQLPYYT